MKTAFRLFVLVLWQALSFVGRAAPDQPPQTADLAVFDTVDSSNHAVGELAYVESPATLQAFAAGLASRQVVEDVHGNQVAVALLLIQAYGEKHPEEPLFSPDEYLKHADETREEFRQPQHQAYLRQLEGRLLALHQLRVTMDPPILLNTDKVEKYH
jgi:hypothetical protein